MPRFLSQQVHWVLVPSDICIFQVNLGATYEKLHPGPDLQRFRERHLTTFEDLDPSSYDLDKESFSNTVRTKWVHLLPLAGKHKMAWA